MTIRRSSTKWRHDRAPADPICPSACLRRPQNGIAHHLSRKRLGLTDVAHRCRQRRNTRHRGSQLALLAVQASARRRVKEHGGSIRPWCRRGSRISGGSETRDYFLTDDFVNVRGGRGRP